MATSNAVAGGAAQPGQTYRFERSRGRVIGELILSPIGAATFLGGAFIFLIGVIDADIVTRLLFVAVLGFFGLMLTFGTLAALRRGVQPVILEVGPKGIWTPETGWLGWDEIAEVRYESIYPVASAHGDEPTRPPRFERIGIVPRDPAVAERAGALRMTMGMLNVYFAVVRHLARRSRFAQVELAPFGVYRYELEHGGLEAVARRIEEYLPVIQGPGTSQSGSPPIESFAASHPVSVDAAPPAGALPPAATGPSVSIRRVSGEAREVLGTISSGLIVLVCLSFVLVFGISAIATGPSGSIALVVQLPFLLVPIAFSVGFGLTFARRPARVHHAQLGWEAMYVGPDGLRLPGMGLVRWDDISEVRLESSSDWSGGRTRKWRIGVVPRPGTVPAPSHWTERLRAFAQSRSSRLPISLIRPGPVAPFGVDASELDASLDEVVEFIRTYHPVHGTEQER